MDKENKKQNNMKLLNANDIINKFNLINRKK